MAALSGSGRERPGDDESLGGYIYAARVKNGSNSVASDALSETVEDNP